MFALTNKVAIVTGGSKGIGKSIALGFAQAGASLVLVARNATELEAAASEITSRGGKALAVPTDVTKSAQVSEMVQRAVKEFGRVDILVNCAGGAYLASTLEMSEEDWDETLALNLKGVFLCCQAAGRVMVEQKSGSIINFASGAGTRPVPMIIHYAAAKAGVVHFTQCLAVEWGPSNVRVNVISPGLVDTAHTREVYQNDPNLLQTIISSSIPMGRIGQPEDFVGLAILLASEDSAFINGALITVGGGP